MITGFSRLCDSLCLSYNTLQQVTEAQLSTENSEKEIWRAADIKRGKGNGLSLEKGPVS